MDSAGRILIPAPLRKFAGLDREAALVGQGRRFELWDVAKWDQQIGRAVQLTGAGMPPELEGFSL
jgi:MraZ protein